MIAWVIFLGLVLLGTGLLMMVGIFPSFGGRAGPWVLMFMGLCVGVAGYALNSLPGHR